MEKNNKANELILREYTEIDEEKFSLLNETIYSRKNLASAVSKGQRDLLLALRTENMYPPRVFSTQLSEMVTKLLSADKQKSMEITVDDLDHVDRRWKRSRRVRTQIFEEEPTEEPIDVDDELEGCTDDTCILNNMEEKESDLVQEMFPFDEVA